MHELEGDKDSLTSNPDNLKVIFKEMIQMCLWYAHVAWLPLLAILSDFLQGECDSM